MTFLANCLPRRQFARNVKAFFFLEKHIYFKMSPADILTQQAKRLFLHAAVLSNSVTGFSHVSLTVEIVNPDVALCCSIGFVVRCCQHKSTSLMPRHETAQITLGP